MSTRSLIIKENNNGTFSSIYCHMDGYLEGNGETLLKHYQDQAKVNALIALGDISYLGDYLEPSDFLKGYGTEAFNHRYDFDLHSPESDDINNHTMAYGRDRGEVDTEAQTYDSLDKALESSDAMIGYFYIFQNGKWYFTRTKDRGTGYIKPIPLKTALRKAQVNA